MKETVVSYPMLTDDELVALVMNVQSGEPLLLPTVDVENESETFAATLRGQRSLAVRGLVDANGQTAPEVDALMRRMPMDVPRLSMFLGDRQFRRQSFLLSRVWRPTGGGWLQQSISTVGTHAFKHLNSSLEVLDVVVPTFVDAAGSLPTTEADDGPFLCLAVVDASGVVAFGVSAGETIMTARSPDGFERANDLEVIASVEQVVSDLVRRCGSQL